MLTDQLLFRLYPGVLQFCRFPHAINDNKLSARAECPFYVKTLYRRLQMLGYFLRLFWQGQRQDQRLSWSMPRVLCRMADYADIIWCRQAFCQFGAAVSKSMDQCESFLCICHGRFLRLILNFYSLDFVWSLKTAVSCTFCLYDTVWSVTCEVRTKLRHRHHKVTMDLLLFGVYGKIGL